MNDERRKVCPACRTDKPWSEYNAKSRHPDGTMRLPSGWCKMCNARRSHDDRKANPERYRARNRRYRASRPSGGRRVPNTGVRTAVLASGVGIQTLADWLDIKHESTLRRALGLSPDGDTGRYRERMSTAMAVAVLDRLGLDPVDAGI